MNEILTPCILQNIIICSTAIIIFVVIASIVKICVVEKRKKELKIVDDNGSSLRGTYIFLSSVVVSIAVIIFSYSFYMKDIVLDFMSLASALISIILAVITIIYSFVVNGQTTGQIDKLVSTAKKLKDSADEVKKVPDSLKETNNNLQKEVQLLHDHLDTIITKINETIHEIKGKEQDYKVVSGRTVTNFKKDVIDNFNKTNSKAGVIFIYLCHKVEETKQPCELSELFPKEIVMHYFGYITALNAIGFTKVDVDFKTKAITSAKVVPNVFDGVLNRIKSESSNEFMKTYKQKIDDYFSGCDIK
jgi:uncharacterized protein YoxC